MKSIFLEVWKHKTRLAVSVGVSFYLVFVPFYPEKFTALPFFVQILITGLIVIANVVLGTFPDLVRLALRERENSEKLGRLESEYKTILRSKEEEFDELKEVIVSFIEHSHTYKDRILRLLKIQGEYLCIAKSSEGLSDIFNGMDPPRPQLPFSKVLTQWPGALKPFENMNIFLLPVSTLEGFNEEDIRQWVELHVIPKVREEREKFLLEVPKKLAKLADEFSFKYMAFVVRPDSIDIHTMNRKFNRDVTDAFLAAQPKKNVARMTQELTKVLRLKELLAVVDWSAFVRLNIEQRALFRDRRAPLLVELEKANLHTITDISQCNPQDLAALFKRAFGRGYSDRKAINLAQKTLAGVERVLTTLRKHGIRL